MTFSPRRRGALIYAGAAGLSLILPACRQSEPEKPAQSAGGVFAEGALRLDLRQLLRDGTDEFRLERLRFEPRWPGRSQRLADASDWGDYRLAVYDASRGELLFRQGFDTGLDPGARAATAVLSVRVPFPRRPVHAAVEKRRGQYAYEAVATFPIAAGLAEIDPAPPPLATHVEVLAESGAPAEKVDIAILGDGYREA